MTEIEVPDKSIKASAYRSTVMQVCQMTASENRLQEEPIGWTSPTCLRFSVVLLGGEARHRREEMFVRHTRLRKAMSKICEELLQLNRKKTNQFKKGQKAWPVRLSG